MKDQIPNVVLETKNLTKRFGDVTAVDDLNLQVYEGEVFGFLGPNGAGKTTSINMICGLLKPDSGCVTLHGSSLNGRDRAIRRIVGVCPQDIVLWERLTCLEQMTFIGRMYGLSRDEARRRVDRLLDVLDLSEKRDQQARTLSGGLQRRLNLAMALVHDPEIVVLDEPEAGLDPQSRVKVRDYIQSLAREKTIILTTHNMDEAERLADRVAIIDHGRLLVLDTPRALKRRLGEGDVLEITLLTSPPEVGIIEKELGKAGWQTDIEVGISGETLILRALDLINLLPRILQNLNALGIYIAEVRLRQNTLEDVFIQLTGRRLRQ